MHDIAICVSHRRKQGSRCNNPDEPIPHTDLCGVNVEVGRSGFKMFGDVVVGRVKCPGGGEFPEHRERRRGIEGP